MGKRRSPMLQKVSNLIKLSIFMAKMRLTYLKKSTKLANFKQLKHYNSYGFLKERQFSPSSTPLIRFHRRRRNGVPMYSICSLSCFGVRHQSHNGMMADENYSFESAIIQVERELEEDEEELEEEDHSVDEKAERFIERFYEEMKRQRRESANFPLNRMLEY